MVRAFIPTENKRLIREVVDRPLVASERAHHGRPLTYFGLPSEGLYDVLDWLEYLGKIVAVEKGETHEPVGKQALLLAKAIESGVSDRLTLLRGELNEIILAGRDGLGTLLPFPFELCNFDYGGSLLYPDRVRVDALEVFVRNQRPCDFLLLATTNTREFDSTELDATLSRVGDELSNHRSEVGGWFNDFRNWMDSEAEVRKQVVHALYLVKNVGEMNRYHVSATSPVLYEGSKHTQLLHYAFTFRFQKGASTKVVSPQKLLDVLSLPLRQLENKELVETESGPALQR